MASRVTAKTTQAIAHSFRIVRVLAIFREYSLLPEGVPVREPQSCQLHRGHKRQQQGSLFSTGFLISSYVRPPVSMTEALVRLSEWLCGFIADW